MSSWPYACRPEKYRFHYLVFLRLLLLLLLLLFTKFVPKSVQQPCPQSEQVQYKPPALLHKQLHHRNPLPEIVTGDWTERNENGRMKHIDWKSGRRLGEKQAWTRYKRHLTGNSTNFLFVFPTRWNALTSERIENVTSSSLCERKKCNQQLRLVFADISLNTMKRQKL